MMTPQERVRTLLALQLGDQILALCERQAQIETLQAEVAALKAEIETLKTPPTE